MRPLPDSLPRQKAYTYIFLIGLTGILIFFYSYPLSTENWAYIRQKITYNTDSNDEKQFQYINENTKEANKPTGSIILQKLFPGDNKSVRAESRQLNFTEVTAFEQFSTSATKSEVAKTGKSRTGPDSTRGPKHTISTATQRKSVTNQALNDISERGAHPDGYELFSEKTPLLGNESLSTIQAEFTTTENEIQSITSKHSTKAERKSSPMPIHEETIQQAEFTTVTMGKTTNTEDTVQKISANTEPTLERKVRNTASVNDLTMNSDFLGVNTTSKTISGIEKGYLVFSEQCRIPDIDPMDPSIAHLISKTPPLDCSETYKPLTKTEGHVLYLNKTAVSERTDGGYYTCCYRSVFREQEGLSDNGVGFGKTCVDMSHETTIKDEFIAVECKYPNGTEFYREFHSFIFDKPKVEKRCGKSVRDQPRYSVLIVGVDAVSRLNMHRQLTATAQYLLKEMDGVEMYGFNKVGDNTFPNLVPLLLGYDEKEMLSMCWKSTDLPLDRCDFLWKKFAKAGYRTLYAEDSPHISSFNYVKKGFYIQPTDYYFRPFILAYEDALSRDKPLNCYLCVGSTSETEAVLHWTGLFASHFAAKRPYFSFSWINSVTHDFLNTGSSADHMYEKFFRKLHRAGALDRTVVILMGDHGMRWGEIRHTYVGRMEERLPMLVISLPKQFKRDHPGFAKTLTQNSHRLVTPFDLHATLMHLLDLNNNWSIATDSDDGVSRNFSKRAVSLFRPIPEDRSCDDASIEEHWCTCESSSEVDIQKDEVRLVAKFILSRINRLLIPFSEKCALLKLDSVSEARLWQAPKEHKGHSADDDIYTVVIHTTPGEAIFEGTVKISRRPKTQSELLGEISRLNLYGNQSACIEKATLKKYCYCL